MSLFLCILGAYFSLCFIIVFALIIPWWVKVVDPDEISWNSKGLNLGITIKNLVGLPIEYVGSSLHITLDKRPNENPYTKVDQTLVIPSGKEKLILISKVDEELAKDFNEKKGVIFLRFRLSSIINLAFTKKIKNRIISPQMTKINKANITILDLVSDDYEIWKCIGFKLKTNKM